MNALGTVFRGAIQSEMSKFSEDLGEEFLIKKHLAIYHI